MTETVDLSIRLKDLLKQATTERSHFYTGSLLEETIPIVEAVEGAKDSLPDEQEYNQGEETSPTDYYLHGRNVYRNEVALPIVAKLIMERDEAREKWNDLKVRVSEATCLKCGRILMKRNDIMPENCPYCNSNMFKTMNDALQQKIKELEAKLTNPVSVTALADVINKPNIDVMLGHNQVLINNIAKQLHKQFNFYKREAGE